MSSEPTIRDLFESNDTKISDKWDSYLDIYNDEFHSYKLRAINLLEIGVSLGGSLEVWARYFTNAINITGIDILEAVESYDFEDKRITAHCINVRALSGVDWFQSFEPDIIIDDASHVSSDVITAFTSLFPFMKDGGVYVVEDLNCAYWSRHNPNPSLGSSIDFFKSMVDFANYQHLDEPQKDSLLKLLNERFRIDVTQNFIESMRAIKSVNFYNSMCFIYKGSGFSDLGKRVVRGRENPLGNPKGRQSGFTAEEIVARKDGTSITGVRRYNKKKGEGDILT